MQVVYRLPAVRTCVHHGSKARLGDALSLGHGPCSEHQFTQQLPVFGASIVERCEVFPWDDENVRRRLRTDVSKGDEALGLVNDVRRNRSVHNSAEQALRIPHGRLRMGSRKGGRVPGHWPDVHEEHVPIRHGWAPCEVRAFVHVPTVQRRCLHRRSPTVNPIAHCAALALRAHAHPALRLSELVELVSGEIDRGLTGQRLLTILEGYPDHFRILAGWQGPWRSSDPATRRGEDPWVVSIDETGEAPQTPRAALRLRESVRWLGRGLDPRPRVEVSRWYAIALAERATREAVARRAA